MVAWPEFVIVFLGFQQIAADPFLSCRGKNGAKFVKSARFFANRHFCVFQTANESVITICSAAESIGTVHALSIFTSRLIMNENQNSRTYGIVIAALLVFSAALGYFFWQKSRSYLLEAEKMETEKVQLATAKSSIGQSLDSLSNSYADLRTENETLSGKITTTAALIQQKEGIIRDIRLASAKDIQELRDQVNTLARTKIEYETIISAIKGENDGLKDENKRLSSEVSDLKGSNTALSGKVEGLAQQLEEQIRKTQSATFRASSFRVTATRRKDKLTTKARRVRTIDVSFDLTNVPTNYQGAQKLYLVITDENGTAIIGEGLLKATVYPPTGPIEITAQQVKTAVLEEVQRLSFNYKFDDRLKSGTYVVAIYSDQGLLGAASFRLS